MTIAKKKAVEIKPTQKDYQILIRPIITEKSSSVGNGGAQVVFEVDRRADKLMIKKAVEAVFSVKVDAVRTANYKGKKKRVTGAVGQTANFKKAYVSLEPGHTIDVVEGL